MKLGMKISGWAGNREGWLGVIVTLACAVLLASAGIFARGAAASAAESGQTSDVVLELKIDGEVEPILATYVEEGLADASQRHAALVLITMDTPGGLSESMKHIIQHILASPVPVAVYVEPTGARGGLGGVLYFVISGYRGDGSGDACGGGIAGDHDWRICGADRRDVSEEDQ